MGAARRARALPAASPARGALGWLALALLLAGPPGALGAGPPSEAPAPPPEQPAALAEQVRGWVRDLASERYEVRERAREALEAQGTRAPEVLREHADAADPEVRRTVRALLARLGTVAEAVPAVAQDLSGMGLVDLRADGLPLRRVLRELGAALGGSLTAPEDALDRPVTLALAAQPAFEAVERLAEAAGLDAAGPFDGSSTLALGASPGALGVSPRGCAGPLRVRATRVESSRPLGVEGAVTHGLLLELQLAPAVQLVTYRPPRVLRAEDAAGRRWRAVPGADASTTYGVGGDTRRVEARVTLERAEPEAEERLARLDLQLELRLRHDLQQVLFEALDGLPRPQERGGSEVVLESLGPAEGRKDAWAVEVSCRLDSEVARASVDVWVEWADGGRRRMQALGGRSSSSADGRLRLVGRVHGGGEAPPRAVRVTWYAREVQGELPVSLLDVPLR